MDGSLVNRAFNALCLGVALAALWVAQQALTTAKPVLPWRPLFRSEARADELRQEREARSAYGGALAGARGQVAGLGETRALDHAGGW